MRREESTQETVALLRDLTTGSAYTFKVVATVNKYGDSDKSPSSADFTVTAEVPDKPPLIYFERDRRTPYSSAKATVVVGSVNGAPIDSYTLEYWINQTDVTPARTTLVQIQTAPLSPITPLNSTICPKIPHTCSGARSRTVLGLQNIQLFSSTLQLLCFATLAMRLAAKTDSLASSVQLGNSPWAVSTIMVNRDFVLIVLTQLTLKLDGQNVTI